MMHDDTADKAALLQDEELSNKDSLESDSNYYTGGSAHLSRQDTWLSSRSLLLAHLGILFLYTAIFVSSLIYVLSSVHWQSKVSLSREDLQATPFHDAFRYDVKTVGYNFEDVNPFKGQSVPQIDKQWLHALNGAHEIRLSEEQMTKANLSSIRLADGSEDFIVQPIAYHMLHCLYNLYKYVHPDFYGDDPSGPDWIVTHTDHCVDNLRQFVQCHAGAGVSTYKWLESRKLPWPILNTEETCIDWDHYDGWVRDHSVDMKDMLDFKGGGLLVHPTLGPLTREDYSPKNDSKST